jgi:hypothetical protein
MFDQSTYTSRFIEARHNLDKLQEAYIKAGAEGDEAKQNRLIPKLEKAQNAFEIEHDKYCDKYGFKSMKFNK